MTPLPTRAAAVLGHGVSERLVQRLLGSDRLRPRLFAALERRLAPLPGLDAAQERILAMDPDGLAGLCSKAGAVWQRDAIAALVNGASVRALDALIGAELRLLALRGPGRGLPRAAASPDAIAAAIPSLGAACLADWCAGQPDAVAGRVALGLPAGVAPPPEPGGAATIAWLLDQP